ncbi:MAG: ABC transporter ATP-binding protein [Bacillota bacterium]
MNLCKSYCANYKWLIVCIMIFKIASTGVELVIPMAFVHMVNEVLPKNSSLDLFIWGGIMLFSAVTAAGVSLFVAHMSAKLGVALANDLRVDLFEKSCSFRCEQVDKITISSLTARLTSDISTLQMFVTKMLTKGIKMVITLIGSLASVAILDIKLSVIMFVAIPLIAIVVYFTTTISFRRFRLTKKANDTLVKTIRENVMGVRVIQALSKNEYEEERFEKVNDTLREKNVSAGIVAVVGSPTMKLIVNLGMIATLLFGGYWVSVGESDPVTIIAFMSYFTMLLTSLVNIGQMFTTFSRAAAATTRIEDIFKEEVKEYVGSDEQMVSEHYIEFRNVTFSYDEQVTLDDVSFVVNKADMLGIIGATGSGKTTILNLLLRLYEPSSGEIFINHRPINSYTKEELYAMYGVVFQSDIIFADTVTENISFGRTIGTEQIVQATKSAQAEGFIQKLKHQYESLINVRGHNISGGEKQRLLISRALADSPDILVLDDSTSALDYRTDARLRKELAKNYSDSTKILVSQRIASIMNAEQILVIENGKMIANGTHAQLLQNCSLYETIANLQLGDSVLYT